MIVSGYHLFLALCCVEGSDVSLDALECLLFGFIMVSVSSTYLTVAKQTVNMYLVICE